jgi:vacuolar-type H+-ATPase subunit H
MDPAEAKVKAEVLVLAAESLVGKAKEEAQSIVADGQRRVAGMVSDADALRQAAERDAQTIRSEAEALLSDARRQADELLAEARRAREEALNSARADLQVARAADAPPVGQIDPDIAVEEASHVANRILRVARSEAESRRREVVDEARRKAEQIERDARARVEATSKEHREMVRTMQARELSAKAKIRELDTEIARLERLLTRASDEADRKGIDTDPSVDPYEPREVTSSGIVFPTASPVPIAAAAPAAEPTRPPTVIREPAVPLAPSRPRPVERLGTPRAPGDEPDAETVRRGIRRRA